jgi:hypothetical protein
VLSGGVLASLLAAGLLPVDAAGDEPVELHALKTSPMVAVIAATRQRRRIRSPPRLVAVIARQAAGGNPEAWGTGRICVRMVIAEIALQAHASFPASGSSPRQIPRRRLAGMQLVSKRMPVVDLSSEPETGDSGVIRRKEPDMHYIHQTLASDIATDRLREAAQARLAADARSTAAAGRQHAGLVEGVARFVRQALARPALAADTSNCR